MKKASFDNWESPPDAGAIGEVIFNKYLYQFELVGILLLVAVVGAIYMAREETKKGEDK